MKLLFMAKYDLLRFFRARTNLLSLFVVPLFLIFILGSALSNVFVPEDREMTPVRTAVVALDRGPLSAQTQAFLNSPDIAALIKPVHAANREEAMELLHAREADFAVVIPERFSELVLSGQSASWEFVFGASRANNLIAQAAFQAYLDQVNLVQQAAMAGISPDVAAGSHAMPEGSMVEAGRLHKDDKEIDAFSYYSVHMLIMFMLYAGMAAAISFIEERELHTLDRLRTLPNSPDLIFAGKLLACLILSALQAGAIVAFTWGAYGVDWSASWGALSAILLFMIVSSISLAVIVSSFMRTTRGVVGAFNFLIMTMTLLSGGFSPDIGPVLSNLGRFTISHWSSAGMQNLMAGEVTKAWEQTGVLGLIALGLLIASAAVYRKAGYHE